MKKSIQTKLFFGTFSLVAFFVLLSWTLNNGYLKKFYIDHKEQKLIETYKRINQIYHGDPERISLQLEKMARISGMAIIIFDENLEEKYNSFPRASEDKDKQDKTHDDHSSKSRNNKHWMHIRSVMTDLNKGAYEIGINGENRLDMVFINLAVILKNHDYLWLETPVIEIEESAAIANQFFLFTGLLVLIIGSIIAYIYAKRFTKPILELNGIARQIAKLDFSRQYNVAMDSREQDEIGQLGKSINILSRELGHAIKGLKEANRKLAEDIERKQKIDEMRKEFVSNVSHELKTPLALIQGYAEGLKSNVMESEEDKEFYCNVIMDEAVKMNKLVKELLDLSQIESGTFQLEQEEFNIADLVDQVLVKYKLRLKEQDISVQVQHLDEIPVIADYSYIERVFINYFDNALHHLDERKMLKVNISWTADKVRVGVFNSGKPIPQEILERIWLSFYKADRARTRSYGGSGLGLSIVKAIMECHHNQYGVINHEDGVEFWFELDGTITKASVIEVNKGAISST